MQGKVATVNVELLEDLKKAPASSHDEDGKVCVNKAIVQLVFLVFMRFLLIAQVSKRREEKDKRKQKEVCLNEMPFVSMSRALH